VTTTDLIVLAASAAVVLFMIGVAAVLGFRKTAKLDEAELARLAVAEGARVDGAAIASDGKTAIARLNDGKVLIARVMADGVSVRVTTAGGVRVQLPPGRVIAAFGDTGFPALNMKLEGAAPGWLSDLAQGAKT